MLMMFSLTPAKEQLREILYTGSVAGAKAPTFFMYQNNLWEVTGLILYLLEITRR